ncbi:hypothetical protein [Sulfuriroseicoccus oceanibius]|uniref:Glycosyltransferase RgtA/B/C/D-like domain-containing protein n=1 Tax=Sulfuriroseicoccus oceanibius TaxID=2707525 RepID=A0A6B3LEL5_9BACT|nr:hypothetical protein [Sulfuriroseicoccus oceanibius]QQL44955.1 hypothetical protein G3M56_013980 [Sulfuriroseicoccus oceanibius]
MAASSSTDSRSLVGWALVMVFVIVLTVFHLYADHRGLTTPEGMDRAQISREIARGNGAVTQNLKPLLVGERARHAAASGEAVDLAHFEDTYHSPLGLWIDAAVLKLGADNWALETSTDLLAPYAPDRMLIALSMGFLIGSVVLAYLLVARIFDHKIGVVVALVMVLCDLLWDFSRSGLPQTQMLFFFLASSFALFRAVENQERGEPVVRWIVLASALFGALALIHWITVWVFLGALVYVMVAFRPRALFAVVMLSVFAVVIAPALIRNYEVTGHVAGDARWAVSEGLIGAGGSSDLMRQTKVERGSIEGLPTRALVTSIDQMSNLTSYMGAMFAAPLFFLTLLHRFKRGEIGDFRWALFSMWVFAVFGMTLFGLEGDEMSTNQMHILFAPLMAAYGVALLAVLWGRMKFQGHGAVVTHGYMFIVVALSALPMLSAVVQTMKGYAWGEYRPNYPYIPALMQEVHDWMEDDEIIVSDMPEGVAWYGDRTAIALPVTSGEFAQLESVVKNDGLEIAAVHISPISANLPLIDGMDRLYKDWRELVAAPQLRRIAEPNPTQIQLKNFPYRVPNPILREMTLWAKRPLGPHADRRQ